MILDSALRKVVNNFFILSISFNFITIALSKYLFILAIPELTDRPSRPKFNFPDGAYFHVKVVRNIVSPLHSFKI